MSSDSEHKFYHHHSSSQENRDFVVKHTPWYFFQCIMCKVEESIVRSNIRKIILQTAVCMISCPHKLSIDIDMEAVVCGRVMDLTRAPIMVNLYSWKGWT